MNLVNQQKRQRVIDDLKIKLAELRACEQNADISQNKLRLLTDKVTLLENKLPNCNDPKTISRIYVFIEACELVEQDYKKDINNAVNEVDKKRVALDRVLNSVMSHNKIIEYVNEKLLCIRRTKATLSEISSSNDLEELSFYDCSRNV